MSKIFICHSSKDHDFINNELIRRLEKENLSDIWIDDWKIEVGDSIIEKINKGIKDSSFFIVVLSQNSIKSNWVNKELNTALMKQLTEKKIKILPIWLEIEEKDIPPLLLDIKAAKFRRSFIDEEEFTKLMEPIKDHIKAEKLNTFQNKFLDNIEHIDIVLKKNEPTIYEINFIFSLIKTEEYENYFFKKIEIVNT